MYFQLYFEPISDPLAIKLLVSRLIKEHLSVSVTIVTTTCFYLSSLIMLLSLQSDDGSEISSRYN